MSLDGLQRRLTKVLAEVQKQQGEADTLYHVVIYDPATGEVLPAWRNRRGAGAIWIPDNKRDNYAAREAL
jgi:hypothetical protein